MRIGLTIGTALALGAGVGAGASGQQGLPHGATVPSRPTVTGPVVAPTGRPLMMHRLSVAGAYRLEVKATVKGTAVTIPLIPSDPDNTTDGDDGTYRWRVQQHFSAQQNPHGLQLFVFLQKHGATTYDTQMAKFEVADDGSWREQNFADHQVRARLLTP